ncbi:MAG: hypothetical protein ACTSRA_08710, partial [Promethearchaeota archaeon]
ELLGLDLDYTYNWYKYGPYSPSLADDAYLLQYKLEIKGASTIGIPKTSEFLSQQRQEAIQKVNELIDELLKFKNDLSEEDLLEFAASIVYLNIYSGFSTDQIKEVLPIRKSKFSPLPSEYDKIVDLLKKYDLIRNCRFKF